VNSEGSSSLGVEKNEHGARKRAFGESLEDSFISLFEPVFGFAEKL
jgi:hypothetical protein